MFPQLMFVRFIDELTPSHLSLLRFSDAHETEYLHTILSYADLSWRFSATTGIDVDENDLRLSAMI